MKKYIFHSDYDDISQTTIDGNSLLLDKELIIDLKHNEDLNFDIKKIQGKLNKRSKITFRSELSIIGKLSEIYSGENQVQLPNSRSNVGDYIVIEGQIVHENYIPNRLKSAKICCQIIHIENRKVKLDRVIPFSLVEVVAYAIPKCNLEISGHLDSVSVDIRNITNLKLNLKFSGAIKDRGVLLNIDTCSKLQGEIKLESCICMIGTALNNVSGGFCNISQSNTGAYFCDSKVVRANALVNFALSYWGKHASFRDVGVHGARNVTMNINSSYGGAELFYKNDSTANRLETIVLAESQNIKIYANIVEANDQGVELISCNDISLYGLICNSTTTESTEGALVIKGESKNIIVDALVYAYQSRAIKVECSRGATNILFTQNNFAFSNDNEAISIRDSSKAYNTNIEIYGKYRALIPIAIRKYSNGCIINAIIDMSIADVGVAVQSPIKNIEFQAINTEKNKQLVSIGGSSAQYTFGVISGDTPGCYIQLNQESEKHFNFNISKKLDCSVKLAGELTEIIFVNGIPYSQADPKFGKYEIGDMYIQITGSLNNAVESKNPIYKVFDGYNWI